MKKSFVLLLGFIGLFMFISCGAGPSDGLPGINFPDDDLTVYEINEDLFDSDSLNSGKIKYTFKDNDPNRIGEYGRTFWNIIEENDSFKTISFSVKKFSGDRLGGFGCVFNIDKTTNSMLALMINTNVSYCIGRVDEGKFTTLKEWTPAATALRSSYGALNTIKIEKVESEYNIYFNGNFVDKITDNSGLPEGAYGCCAVMTVNEKFPKNPVNVEWEF